MDILEKLSEIDKTVYLKPSSDLTVLIQFYEVYNDILINRGQAMQEYSPALLNTLISILISMDEDACDAMKGSPEHTQRLVNVMDNLSASFPKPENGNQSFVKFLWTLRMGSELYTDQNVLQDYDMYIDHIESLPWLFQLELDNQPVYPISNLLNDRILDHFDPDSEDDLLYLITSLQLFNQLRHIPAYARRQTVLELSRQYNLKIVEMLCNGGELLFGNSRKVNMEKNRIMGVRCEASILIRTTDLSRRAPADIQFDYEINKNQRPIAKYFIYMLEPNHELCSLDTFFRTASPRQCLAVLMNCLKCKVYNVFMEDSVIYNSDDKEFVGWVNPLVFNDQFIISCSSSSKSDSAAEEIQFFSGLDDRAGSWFRPTVLIQRGIDRLTLDYIIEFYRKVCAPLNISAHSILCDENSVWNQEYLDGNGIFAQNLVAKSFFDHVLNHNHDIPRAIISYTEFIRTHYDYEGDVSSETRLIFPYSFYMPFDTEEELLTAMLKSKSVTVTDGRIVYLKSRRPKGWQSREIDGSFTVLDISTQEEVTPPNTSSEFSGLYDPSSGIVYILSSPNDKIVINAYKDLQSLSDSMVITQENLSRYNSFLHQRSLEKLIYGIGIPGEITKLFWPGPTPAGLSCDRISPLILFKILHHINYYQITEEKLDDWKKLIFTCHLVAPSSSSHPMYDSFKNGVSTRNHDRNCLMISKRSFADKSTLGAILNMQRERLATDIAFDAAAINQQIMRREETGQYHLARNGRPQQKICNIVFLTDNIISGGSTYKMLAFHFNGQPATEPSSSYYIKLDSEKTILKIINANHPRIELHTVFWFSCLDGCTVHSPTDGFYPVDFHVNETEKIRFYVKAYQSYSPEQYLYTEEAFELASSIYGKNNIPQHYGQQEHRRLVFRFNNMPGFSVFPKEVLSIKNKVGLFERRK